jgi:hypothetical protein
MKSDHILLEKQPPRSIIWTALMMLTLGVGMAIFYEATGERKYWVNRWRLWRSLRAGRVRIEKINEDFPNRFKMWIDDRAYTLSIYKKATREQVGLMVLISSSLINEDNFTVSSWMPTKNLVTSGGMIGDSMIGLFTGSLLTNWLRRSSHKMLCDLTDQAKVREKKLEKIGI